MFFNKVWQKISTGTDFRQEKPDWENRLCLQNDIDFDKIFGGKINSEF